MRGQRKFVSIALMLLIIAGIVFYYSNIKIPLVARMTEGQVRREVDVNSMPKTKVAVITDVKGINKYTELTDKIINEKVKLLEIPTQYVIANGITDLESIRGKVTKEDLRMGEQIALESLSNEEKWFGDFERLKEYTVSSIVANEVKPGNIIDLLVSYKDGSYRVVVPKIKVIRLITEGQEASVASQDEDSGVVPQRPSGKQNYTLIIAVNEENYRDLELAKTLGNLETRLYLDESQPASPKTFEYELERNRLPINEKDGESR